MSGLTLAGGGGAFGERSARLPKFGWRGGRRFGTFARRAVGERERYRSAQFMRVSALSMEDCPRGREAAGTRTLLLVLVFFLFGALISAVWFGTGAGRWNRARKVELSTATKTALQSLTLPVEVRFYSLLDTSTVAAAEVAFSSRVDGLLTAYQEASTGKVTVTRINTDPEGNANAASADGVKPFGLEKGLACYLGLVVTAKEHKEVLPRLSADWEAALESDVTRAILRVAEGRSSTGAQAPVAITAPRAPVAPELAAEVKRAIPALETVSVEEGTRILKEAGLREFTEAVKAMAAQTKEAQDRLVQAQASGSEGEKEAALQHLRQVQAEQTEKLQEMAARTRAQTEALQQLKSPPR